MVQHHKNASRDGVYVDSALTQARAATMHLDTSFAGTLTGSVYAQPLYVANGPHGAEAFIVATESNHVTAIDGSGHTIWDKIFGTPVTGGLPCGNIKPLGITGTPYIDTAGTIYFEQQDLFEWTVGNYSYNRFRVAHAGDVPLHPGAARYYRQRGYLR